VAEAGRAIRFWCAVLVLYGIVTVVLSAVGAPSPFLFAGVVAGAIGALRLPNPRPFPDRVHTIGIAAIGVGAGAKIDREVLDTVLASPVAIMGGVVATLAISMTAGQVLRFSPHVNGTTAIFASIAGGASGVTAVAREMDADEAIVLSIQYLRVLFVLATIPVIAIWFGATGELTGPVGELGANWPSVAFTATAMIVGLGLALVFRFSASRLVMPLLVATGFSVLEVFPGSTVPALVLNFGYATTGLMVGSSFTPSVLRQLRQLMPLALLQVLLSVSGCALVGLAFSELTGSTRLDGYLATTPGGLPAVTAVAIGSGAGVGLIVTMQLTRIFLALVLAPVIAAVLRHRRRGEASA
jgi:uncharacterized protein